MKKILARFPKKQDGLTRSLGLITASVITAMLLLQLFTFEKLPVIFSQLFGIDGGIASVIAGLIVITELLSLPFLLMMAISPLLRGVGMACGLLAILFWIGVGKYTLFNDMSSLNSGLLGSKVPLPGGLWLVLMVSGMLVMYIWYVVRSDIIRVHRIIKK